MLFYCYDCYISFKPYVYKSQVSAAKTELESQLQMML